MAPTPELLREFVNPMHEFSIKYPPKFDTFPASSPDISLILKHRDTGFPTFNIAVRPGKYSSDARSQSRKILDEYRAVGITDGKIINSFESRISRFPALTAEIEYKSSRAVHISSVTVVSSPTKHYILTYIDLAPKYDSNKYLRDGLLNSFVSWDGQSELLEIRSQKRALRLNIILALLLGLTVGFLIIAGYIKIRDRLVK